jgi:hypothetical protein
MTHIPSPQSAPGDRDRGSECQEVLGAAFEDLAQAAQAAGWAAQEIDRTLLDIAVTRMRAAVAGLEADRLSTRRKTTAFTRRHSIEAARQPQ